MVSTLSDARVVAIGECMLELRSAGDHWELSYAGDTLNTATYLARLGEDVAFLTALGADSFSNRMRDGFRANGVRLDLVLTSPGRRPGLYAIETDAAGERHFHYWREQAAVRELFRLPGHREALERAAGADLIYLSGITLALFDLEGRSELAALARRVRAGGGDVAFDPNYRPSLWSSDEAARRAIEAFAPLATIVLPTFVDEAALHGDTAPGVTLARWKAAGARDIVVKLGSAGCVLSDGRMVAPPERGHDAVDTTGAGDAFNAGYLFCTRLGYASGEAAAFANSLAGRVVQHRGAILPADQMPAIGEERAPG